MSKKLQLHIPEQCHENWEEMVPEDKGKFCGSCQKHVTDFSKMSDRQIAEFFKKPSTGSVCGRFMKDQLDRDIDIQKKRLPWIKYFFQFAIPAFLITRQAHAQGGVSFRKGEAKKVVCDNIAEKSRELAVLKDAALVIRTSIVNSVSGQPVSFASITIAETNTGLYSDHLGAGTIRIENNLKALTITVSSIGYKPVTINQTLSADIIKNGLIIPLVSDIIDLPEVVVLAYGSTMVRGRYVSAYNEVNLVDSIKKWFTVPKIPSAVKPGPSHRVYPNPAKCGTSITIEIGKHEEGRWIVELLNIAGQSITKKEIWMEKNAATVNLEIPGIAGGVYFLHVTNKNRGKGFTEKIIVE